MAMASTERPNGYGGATMSANAPANSSQAPANQTPGHPSFRRFVEDLRMVPRSTSLTRSLTDNVHRELVRYEAIQFLLYSLWLRCASAPRMV